jgi:hypothetical protein
VSSSALLGLLSALLGGGLVSVIAFVAGRDKTRAETRKLEAETTRIKVETAGLVARNRQSEQEESPIPGWFLTGSDPDDYSIDLDRAVFHSGEMSALLEASPGARGFGTLMQTVSAGSMRGKRIRMSAYLKSDQARSAGLWMRVDGPGGAILAFDNMQNRPIKGTLPWRKYTVVLDVGDTATEVAFGALLIGQGSLWVDDFTFGEVGEDVATTDIPAEAVTPPLPLNLDFSDEP